MLRSGVGPPRIGKGERVAGLLSSWTGFTGLLAIIAVYYLFLLSNGTFRLFAPEMLDRTFDSMLVHLLHGEFNVDRRAIDWESFSRDGKTYTYFGVFPALLRLVAMPFTDVAQVQFARLSCLTALVVFVALQLRTLLVVHNTLPAGSRVSGFLAVMAAATILSGPQLYILGSATIYHETILWSAAMGAAFNLIVLRAALGGGCLGARDLVSLAILAGLAINTRPVIGVALCLGTVLLVAWTGWRRHISAQPVSAQPLSATRKRLMTTIAAVASDPRILLPFLALGLFAVACGVVNFERWGNPFSFADFHDYDFYRRHPQLAAVLRNYGDFDLGRIWIGALYYATGIPYVLKTVPPFDEFLRARYTGIEAPPITPLLTNPLTIFLAGVGLCRLWWRPGLAAGGLAILRLALVGNASAIVLIFSAAALELRYRFDLTPFMTLAAFVGYRFASIATAASSEAWRRRTRIAAVGLCVFGILLSHYVLLIHKVWSLGEPMEVRRTLSVFAPFAFKP
jgi:hypothetical protein